MLVSDFSALSGKEMNVKYEVEGHAVILTDKHRERKAGAQTFFDGTVDGVPFEGKNVKAVCRLINGDASSPRGPRKTAIKPKNAFRLFTEDELMAESKKLWDGYCEKVSAYIALGDELASFREKYNITNEDEETNILAVKAVFEVEQKEAVEKAKRNARLKAVYEGRLQVRRDRLQDEKEKITADMVAGKMPNKKAMERLQALQSEYEDFSNRLHVWEID